jgi:hypothetical protein
MYKTQYIIRVPPTGDGNHATSAAVADAWPNRRLSLTLPDQSTSFFQGVDAPRCDALGSIRAVAEPSTRTNGGSAGPPSRLFRVIAAQGPSAAHIRSD